VCPRILLRNLDAEEPVPSRDVEHLHRIGPALKHDRTERTSQRRHHRRHALGELHPDRVLWFHRALAG